MIKTLSKKGIEGKYPNIIRPYIILSGEKRSFPSKNRNRTRMSSLATLSTVLGVPATAVRQEKQVKGIHTENEKVKVPLFCR